MTSLRASSLVLVLATAPLAPATLAASPASAAAGYVDGSTFRALIDENQEVVEVNLEGPILQAVANSKNDGDPEAKDLFGKLKAIHAVIGTVKGPASEALALVKKTDEKLVSAGWQRITRIKDESSTISVLTHMNGDRIDGLVALIFDADDKELVFANLAGEIDLNRLGEIGDRLHVPGLNNVPGVH
jgi:uncharacterized protein DUF4252